MAAACPPEPTDSPATRIADAPLRRLVRVSGRIVAAGPRPWGEWPAYECELDDGSGRLLVIFLGHRTIAGVGPDTCMTVEGRVLDHRGRKAVLNPAYSLDSALRRQTARQTAVEVSPDQ